MAPIILHDAQGVAPSDWYKLTPDINGNYLNGTLTQIASLPSAYSPLYFSSEILNDGRLLIEGDEYNFNNSVWTTMGAIYDPVANTWAMRTPPAGWGRIGDAEAIMLADGTYMQSSCCDSGFKFAFLAPPYTDGSWTSFTGQGKADSYDEEGFTILPNNKILTVDANRRTALTASEIFDPTTHTWSAGPSTIVSLTDLSSSGRGCARVRFSYLRFGREESVFVVCFRSDESLGFLLPCRSAGLDCDAERIVGCTRRCISPTFANVRQMWATRQSQKKNALNTLERGRIVV